MLLWESANANANDTLFINKIAGILEKYGMHTPMELLIIPPSKHMGKTMIKKAINEYWYKKYNEEKSTKTGVCIPYFSRIPAILLINNVSFALAFADSHSSICFSIVESSLTIPKNKFIQYLSSVTSIGSAPVNA
jgi:hypothetical protein